MIRDDALLSAVGAIVDLGGCSDPACTDAICWLGCLDGDARTAALEALRELGEDDG